MSNLLQRNHIFLSVECVELLYMMYTLIYVYRCQKKQIRYKMFHKSQYVCHLDGFMKVFEVSSFWNFFKSHLNGFKMRNTDLSSLNACFIFLRQWIEWTEFQFLRQRLWIYISFSYGICGISYIHAFSQHFSIFWIKIY